MRINSSFDISTIKYLINLLCCTHFFKKLTLINIKIFILNLSINCFEINNHNFCLEKKTQQEYRLGSYNCNLKISTIFAFTRIYR